MLLVLLLRSNFSCSMLKEEIDLIFAYTFALSCVHMDPCGLLALRCECMGRVITSFKT